MSDKEKQLHAAASALPAVELARQMLTHLDECQRLSRFAGIEELHIRTICEALVAGRQANDQETSLGIPRDIATAPECDGWILAYDPDRAEHLPLWRLATRCDDGWRDEDGYVIAPTMWARCPDPQPAPTGWGRPQGHLRISRAWSDQIHWLTHLIDVMKPDGSYDDHRQPVMANSLDDARQRAAAWGEKLGLPVVEMDDENVVPFKRREQA
ncbi:hypothetical protein [Sphingobium yanoikuyae]|uniref:hypothetical protein n=1 Tax=Sphingobium yanoikuyae TaxID=13690 RepID=UPI00289BA064|nr:hypothetical protein [Sphingobium yanoikuyae]